MQTIAFIFAIFAFVTVMPLSSKVNVLSKTVTEQKGLLEALAKNVTVLAEQVIELRHRLHT